MAKAAVEEHGISERQACRYLGVSRTAYRYQPQKPGDDEIIHLLKDIAEQKPRWGFKKMVDYLKNEGYRWNHKKIHRIYTKIGLNIRVKPKKRFPCRNPKPLQEPEVANIAWSMDFMSEGLESCRKFRTLNIIDDFNREVLWIEINTSLPAERVIWVLDMPALWHGYPQQIRIDNGPEFISHKLAEWAEEYKIVLDFIEPGNPAQNAYIERFNRTYREDILDAYIFDSIQEVRAITDEWLEEYNGVRPHDALGGLPPYQFKAMNS